MKKEIFLFIIVIQVYAISYAQTITTYTGTSGSISIHGAAYNCYAFQQYNINTNSSDLVELNITLDIERECDFLSIYECNNDLTPLKCISTYTGYGNYTISSTTPNGKLVIIFTSDESICGDEYDGFTITYQNTLYSTNNFNQSGPVTLNSYGGTNLMINDFANKNMGTINSITTNYAQSMILMKSGTYQLGLGPNKISAYGNLGLSASGYLYQTSTGFCFSTPSVSNMFSISSSNIDVKGNVQISNAEIPMGLTTEVLQTTPLLNLDVNFRGSRNTSYIGAAFRIDTRANIALFQWLSRAPNSGEKTIMSLTKDGNLGINTTSMPTERLEVIGNVKATKFIGDGSGLTGIAGLSQWTTNGSNISYNSGNVLVGKTTQTNIGYKLDVEGNAAFNGNLSLISDINLGRDLILDGANKWILHTPNDGRTQMFIAPWVGSDWAWELQTVFYNNGNVLFNGSVGMGVDPGNYKLNVWGNIRAHEVIINTDGADFVFDENYKLRSLQEVENFIKQHKHLPEIAPASEMQKNGASLGELQTKLLQKIEELMLYVIAQEKKIEKLENIISSFEHND